LPFHIHTYESDKVAREPFGKVEEKFPYAIYFINNNLSKYKLKYTVTKKELLDVEHRQF